MRLSWTNGVPDESLRESWDELVLRMERPEVFYTWEWAAAVARSFGDQLPPLIATAHDGDELVGVAAFAQTSPAEVAFLSGSTADYCDFISLVERRQEFVSDVLCELRESGIQKIVLANLPADSATVNALRKNESFHSFFRTGYICAQVHLGEGSERQALAEALSKKKMFRRSFNALKRIGRVDFRHDGVTEAEPETIAEFCVLHVARFLATGRLSNLIVKERREFLCELARLLCQREWFDMMNLYVAGQLVASNYGFRFRGSWFWYQPTIVNRFEDKSPGFCLLTKMVENASKEPSATMIDLGLGAEGYKERFANAERRTLYVTLSERPGDLWRARGRYYAARAVQSVPMAEPVARRAQKAAKKNLERARECGWTSVFSHAGRRMFRSLAGKDQVQMFQWPVASSPESAVVLVSLSWEVLSRSAMRYAEDRETLDYILRASGRFHSQTHAGFAVLGEEEVVQHFAWVAPYDGFFMAELGETLHASSSNSVLIYDCWTPRELRGRGLYARAIAQLATHLQAEGKEVWIFGAAENVASLAGIRKAGFQHRFSLVKRGLLGRVKTRQEPAATRTLEPAA